MVKALHYFQRKKENIVAVKIIFAVSPKQLMTCSFNRVFTNIQSWQCWHHCQLCIAFTCSCFFLFVITDASKCEIRSQEVCKDYISRLHTSLDPLIVIGRAKMKLAMLAFLYCGEFVKNSNDWSPARTLQRSHFDPCFKSSTILSCSTM